MVPTYVGLYSVGIYQGNQLKSLVFRSRMTHFILQVHRETVVVKTGEGLEKRRGMDGQNEDKEEIPGSGKSMRGYILTCSRL